eukprot:TRINITY_DN55336_c0_g1_i1.p1 TRINITY_DN55336_c0_g1~~TRINITY_DN55336_c0_g1_i1.p1  ORF type:complete len:450 (-),score=90.25 TRINITY_DN55336_c0_g1_i1:40-1389(-)
MPFSAADIARQFVKQYTNLLHQQPHNIHKFYKQASVYSFTSACDDEEVTATGQNEIGHKIVESLTQASPNGDVSVWNKAEIVGLTSQNSRKGGVVVHVTGYFPTCNDDLRQHFTRTFFLDKQTEPCVGYFVSVDMVRFSVQEKMVQSHQVAHVDLEMEEEQPEQYAEERRDEEGHPNDGQDANRDEHAADAKEELQHDGAGNAADATEAPRDHASSPADVEAVDEPKTWASMAGRLPQGNAWGMPQRAPAWGGRGSASAVTGLPAATPGFPPPGAVTAAASTATPAAAATRAPAAGKGSTGAGNSSAASGASGESRPQAWLWVARLPVNTTPVVENSEIAENFDRILTEAGLDARTVEVDRRDTSQEWASVLVSTQEAADALVTMSKERKLLLNGKNIKADVHRGVFGRRAGGRGGGGGYYADYGEGRAEGKGGRKGKRPPMGGRASAG